MPTDIKKRAATRGIKELDRGVLLGQAVRQASVTTKGVVGSRGSGEETEGGWSAAQGESDHIAQLGARTLRKGVRAFGRAPGRRTAMECRAGMGAGRSKSSRDETEREAPIRDIRRRSEARMGRRAAEAARSSVRSRAQGAARARAVGSAHQAARTSRRTARASRAAATRFARMAALQARTGIAALGSLGAVAAVAVVVICLVGLVAASAFGIFFSGGDMGDGNPTLREAVAALDAEHEARIEQEKASEAHDEVALSGSTTPWRDVLAVFAVKVAADPSDPRDVITLDDARMDSLRSVFWDMNSIEVSLEERQVTEVGNEEGDAGETGTVKVLRITLASRTADEMADAYGFDAEQREILSELLDERYDAAWRTVLHGVAGDSGEIVEVAASQIGNVGGQPYWSWYGFDSRVEWCACFVSWCANECGLIESGAVPKFSYCPAGVQWFKDAGLWRAGGEEPQPGDIVFFDWEGDGTSDHVGIVESCDGRTVETIEGNSGDACRRNAYDVGSASIMGYGTPMY